MQRLGRLVDVLLRLGLDEEGVLGAGVDADRARVGVAFVLFDTEGSVGGSFLLSGLWFRGSDGLGRTGGLRV